MRLLPKEEKFYDYFLAQAKLISEAGTILRQGAEAGNSELQQAAVKVKALEERGDEVIHDVLRCLNQTFITPLDPEDIHSLSSHLDDVLDGIEDAAHRMVSYRMEPIPATAVELCKVVEQCGKAMERAFTSLRDNRPILDDAIEINRLEEVADQMARNAVGELFRLEKDPITLLKLKEVYELLEQTTDYCEDVADALQNVVVKNT